MPRSRTRRSGTNRGWSGHTAVCATTRVELGALSLPPVETPEPETVDATVAGQARPAELRLLLPLRHRTRPSHPTLGRRCNDTTRHGHDHQSGDVQWNHSWPDPGPCLLVRPTRLGQVRGADTPHRRQPGPLLPARNDLRRRRQNHLRAARPSQGQQARRHQLLHRRSGHLPRTRLDRQLRSPDLGRHPHTASRSAAPSSVTLRGHVPAGPAPLAADTAKHPRQPQRWTRSPAVVLASTGGG